MLSASGLLRIPTCGGSWHIRRLLICRHRTVLDTLRRLLDGVDVRICPLLSSRGGIRISSSESAGGWNRWQRWCRRASR